MVATLVAALLKEQAPGHVEHRAFEVDEDAVTPVGTVEVKCSCNLRLTLTLPKAPGAEEAVKSARPSRKEVPDAS